MDPQPGCRDEPRAAILTVEVHARKHHRMDFFDRQWSTCRAVLDHDLMQHRAAAALGPVASPCQWREQDLLAWAEAEPGPAPVDLLHSAFAIHHLNDDDKARFLRLSSRQLAPQGLFLWADVFRPPVEP